MAVKNVLRAGVIGMVMGAALWGAEPVLGQANPANPLTSRGGPGQPESREFGPTLSVAFPGGTVEDYIGALQKAAGDQPVNVVIPSVAKQVKVPEISLRNVTVYTALSAVRSAFEENSEHRFEVRPIGQPSDASFSLQYQRVNRNNPSNPLGVDESKIKHLEVYSVRDMIEPAAEGGSAQARVAYEDVLAAVETAMQLLEQEQMPKMMFHKQTGLLMVAGTLEQNAVVREVLSRIRTDLEQRWSAERSGKKASTEKQRRAAIMASQLEIVQLESQAKVERFKRMEKLAEAGQLSVDELATARLEAEKAVAELNRAKLEYEAATQDSDPQTEVAYDIGDLLKVDGTAKDRLMKMLTDRGTGATVEFRGASLVARGTEAQLAKVSAVVNELRSAALKKK